MASIKELEKKWTEIESIPEIEVRRKTVFDDVYVKKPIYKVLAKEDPQRLFNLLGGDVSEIETKNWAIEYTYEQYIEENDIEYDSAEAKVWDLSGKSIEHAEDTGHWYVTGVCILCEPNGGQLPFEFEFCEGEFDGIIGTPYNQEKHDSHGFLF